jgi:hypothetical protein
VREKIEPDAVRDLVETIRRTVKARVSYDEQIAFSTIWREALAIIRRYPLATMVPALVLGALASAPNYFIEEDSLSTVEDIPTLLATGFAFILTLLATGFAFYLYMAYAEEIAIEAERGTERITVRDMVSKLGQASPFVPLVMVASTISFVIETVSLVLLVLPGLWLLTRWSLFAPVIVRERLGPVAALKRSNHLVRGHFWLVFGTATVAFILEEIAIEAGVSVGFLVSGSHTWGEWIGGSLVASLITPLAAFATSVVYARLAARSNSPGKEPL